MDRGPPRGRHREDKDGGDKTAVELVKELQDNSFAHQADELPEPLRHLRRRRKRSYRELPWRVADFGRLHRYERGGVVHGLVARAHASARTTRTSSARASRSPAEIERFIKILYGVYKAFGFEKIDIKLATRPDEAHRHRRGLGRERGRARGGPRSARACRSRSCPGEGAFYGPKVEFHVQDALKRSWQLGTIQYDPNLPERFELDYVGEDGKDHRPVMLHRAVLGSLERFFGVYLEHCGGNFPAWIAPKQAIVLTVSEKSDDYGRDVLEAPRARRASASRSTSSATSSARRSATRARRATRTCSSSARRRPRAAPSSVRSRDEGELGAMPFDQFTTMLAEESKSPS